MSLDFDLNMNFNGLTPSTGGGGQFPPNTPENPYWRARIVGGERKFNSQGTGDVTILEFEGLHGAALGIKHKYSINTGHQDPEVVKRGTRDMFAVVYAATGQTQIARANLLFGKEVGVVCREEEGKDQQGNPRKFSRVDRVIFADGRELIVNGQAQPFQAPQNQGNFNAAGGNAGGGFGGQTQQQQQTNAFTQTQQQQPDPNANAGQTQNFNSGAQTQDQGQFNGGGSNVTTMPNPNANANNNNGGYNGGPGNFGGGNPNPNPNAGGQPAGKPNW